MWPFRKKSLPPPPALEPLSGQSAAVMRVVIALDRLAGVADVIRRQTKNAVLAVYLEQVGTAKADLEIRSDGVLAHWRTWQAYDKHAKKRSEQELSENNSVAEIELRITLPTSPIEQHQGIVMFFNVQSGDARGFSPTSLVPPEYRSWDVSV